MNTFFSVWIHFACLLSLSQDHSSGTYGAHAHRNEIQFKRVSERNSIHNEGYVILGFCTIQHQLQVKRPDKSISEMPVLREYSEDGVLF